MSSLSPATLCQLWRVSRFSSIPGIVIGHLISWFTIRLIKLKDEVKS